MLIRESIRLRPAAAAPASINARWGGRKSGPGPCPAGPQRARSCSGAVRWGWAVATCDPYYPAHLQPCYSAALSPSCSVARGFTAGFLWSFWLTAVPVLYRTPPVRLSSARSFSFSLHSREVRATSLDAETEAHRGKERSGCWSRGGARPECPFSTRPPRSPSKGTVRFIELLCARDTFPR